MAKEIVLVVVSFDRSHLNRRVQGVGGLQDIHIP
jgi:hypothetical protein